MYKITHYDYNCCPICDGTVSFFTEDIEAFQKRWFAMDRLEEGLKEKFLRSKGGELVTDWYGNDPELNIVQQDQSTVYGEKTVTLEKQTFEAHNAYQWASRFYVDRWIIRFQWMGFRGKYYRLASYQADGVCRFNIFCRGRWDSVVCHGNPVLENTVKYKPNYPPRVDESQWDNPGFDDFKENRIETICWLVNDEFDTEEELKADISSFEVTEEIMDWLFADVVGEGG